MRNQQIAVNAAYFYRESLPVAVERIADVGLSRVEFDGLSLVALSPAKIRELKKVLNDSAVECVSVSAVTDLVPVNLGNLSSLNARERNRAIDHLKRCLDCAAELAVPRIVCDTGTTTEDFVTVKAEFCDEVFAASLQKILLYADQSNSKVVLLEVPGRFWSAWDGFPPDKTRVVERHVWPWRIWRDREESVDAIERRFPDRFFWALDTANELVAHGVHPFKLEEVAAFYLKHKLEIVYLANHPGPYNKVWHRLLLHQPIRNGYYKPAEYGGMLNILGRKKFRGEIILQVREKDPDESSLKRNIAILTNK